MAQSTARIDVFELDPSDLTRNAINAIRVSFGIVGVIGMALGVALLVWPGKSAAVVAALIGIWVLVAGIVRVGMGVFSRGVSGGHRTLDILLGLVLIILSVAALRNLTLVTETLLLIAMIVLGISWIVEGIIAFIESGKGRSQGWAITYGVISVLAGIAVLVWPGWSIVTLAAIAGITFIVLGILGVVRAFTFGKDIVASDSDAGMTAQGDAGGSEEVPQDVARAARLWADSPDFESPSYAAWLDRMVWRSLWKFVAVAVVVTLATLAVLQARQLIAMLIVALFFALAIVPGVNALVRRWKMRRGAAVGIIFALATLGVIFMVAVLIPAIVGFAEAVEANAADWFASLNTWATDTFGGSVINDEAAADATATFAAWFASWADNVLGAVTSGIGIIFDFFTIAAFTFYFAADFPKLRRAIMARMTPERQRVFAWVTDTSIEQTGGYFYSRLLLMLVNGGLALGVMVLIGLPTVYAIPLALFMGFVSEFIPFIGTYIGAIIPTLLILAVLGPGPAIAMLIWVVIYQQIENYVLSPRFSSRTMELSGAVAFGGALAGGAIAGPMGAFMALPIAALITAVVKNAGKTYAVVVDNLEGPVIGQDVPDTLDGEAKPARDAKPARRRPLRRSR